MVHPLSKHGPVGYELSCVGTRTLHKNPALAALAMECIATWSHVEHFIQQLFVTLAGGSHTDASAVYFSIENEGARANAMRSLAEMKIGAGYMPAFNQCLKVIRKAAERRHALAHHTWGFSVAVPDALLLRDPRKLSDEIAKHSEIFVYKERDFVDILTRFERMATLAGMLLFFVNTALSFPDKKDRIYQTLCCEPEIAERLRRLDAQVQTPPAEVSQQQK